jgi:hypothetical protein
MPSIATPTLHTMFDQLAWLLLPEECIVNIYHNALSVFPDLLLPERGKFPVIEVCLLFLDLPQVLNWVILEWKF